MRRRSLMLATVVAVLSAGVAPAAGEDKLLLKLKLNKGDVYRMSFDIDQVINQTLPGQAQPQQMKQKIGMNYRLEVQDVDAAGAATVQTIYDHVRFRQEGPAGVIEYDSTKPGEPVHPMAKGFAALEGQGFTMVVTPEAQVSEVRGVDALLDAVMQKLEVPPGPIADNLNKTLKRQFGEEAMREQMQNLFAFYPKNPIAPGESWTQKLSISMGFPMVLENTYTLKERQDGVATIAIDSKLSTNPDAEPLEMGPVKMTYDLKGNQSGTSTVDEATGWTTAARMKQDIEGEMKMTVNDTVQSVPIQVSSQIVLHSKKAPSSAGKE